MTYTTNLGLTKDAPTERYDVGRVNANSDRIDTFAGEARANINNLQTDLAGKQDLLLYDTEPTENSQRMVKSGGIYTALTAKQDTLVAGGNMDRVPTADSVQPVTSGGVFTAMFGNYYVDYIGDQQSPNNDDLNHYRTPGVWYASATAAGRVANTPYTSGVFKLEVFVTYQSSTQMKFIQRIWIGGARYYMRGGTTTLTGTNAGKTTYNNWFEYAGSDTGSGSGTEPAPTT